MPRVGSLGALPSIHVISHSGSHSLTPLSHFLWPPPHSPCRALPSSRLLFSIIKWQKNKKVVRRHLLTFTPLFLFLCLCPFIRTVSWTKRKCRGWDRGSVGRSLCLSGCQPLGAGWQPGTGSAPGSARLVEVPGGGRSGPGWGMGDGGGWCYLPDWY